MFWDFYRTSQRCEHFLLCAFLVCKASVVFRTWGSHSKKSNSVWPNLRAQIRMRHQFLNLESCSKSDPRHNPNYKISSWKWYLFGHEKFDSFTRKWNLRLRKRWGKGTHFKLNICIAWYGTLYYCVKVLWTTKLLKKYLSGIGGNAQCCCYIFFCRSTL